MIARLLRQLAFVLVLALAPALVSGAWQLAWKKEEPLAPGEVRLATAREWGDKVQWVDARSRAKYERTHLPGALLLNEDEWDTLVKPFIDEWDSDKTLVVYCDGGTCDASHAVAARIRKELSIPDVYVLKGGFAEWEGK
ncbi:MAG: rhodanese-like domain-containing protein [Chthoniobacter sp.]|nr:rhodanese-like domain-containing protein [Chthoniobacter sp.]